MADHLADLDVYDLLTLGTAPYSAPRFSGVFRHNSFFIGADMRDDVAEGRADYTPLFLSEVPRLFASGQIAIDVALIQVSPPDEHGNCSFGVAVDVTKPAAESARVRIAQVNRGMPRTLGDSFIHVDQLDAIVEIDEPILTAPLPAADDVSREIGRQVAKLVEDGCCLQIGIGAVPAAMLEFLYNRKDLGLHTEMFTDAVIDLAEEGIINNARKRIHRGKIVASFCMGTQRLYDFVAQQPPVRVPTVRLRERPLRHQPERRHGRRERGPGSGPHRSGLFRLAGLQLLQRDRRTGGLHPRGGPFAGREAGDLPAVAGASGPESHRRSPLRRRRGGDHPRRRALRGHRVRHRPAARPLHPRARDGPHRDSPP